MDVAHWWPTEQIRPFLFVASALFFVVVFANAGAALALFIGFVLLFASRHEPVNRAEQEYFLTCTSHSTRAACDCQASGSCDCIETAFLIDTEWAEYRDAVCKGLPADRNRLLKSYDPDQCTFGDCSQGCTEKLKAIKDQILNFNESKCSGAAQEQPFSTGKTLELFPLPTLAFKIAGGVAMGTAILVLIQQRSNVFSALTPTRE